MAGLLAQVATVSLLRSAWLDVLSNDSDDGVLGAGVSRFADDAEDNLGKLADRVLAGTYRPGRLTRLTVRGSGANCRGGTAVLGHPVTWSAIMPSRPQLCLGADQHECSEGA
jgi:hypothetical protein